MKLTAPLKSGRRRKESPRHCIRTWVTLWHQDMGNRFLISWHDFRGYAVEKHFSGWGAVAIGQSTASERTVGVELMSFVWGQPQDCLQVAAALHRRRAVGFGRSFSPTQARAAAHAAAMDSTDPARAPTPSPLGTPKDSGLFAASLRAGAGHHHHCPVAAALATGPAPAPAVPQSLL